MSYDYTRYNDLKAKILAILKSRNRIEPFEVAGYHLDLNGTWLNQTTSGFSPIERQSFDGLIDQHGLDYFTGTRDTFQAHEREILESMEEALAQLSAP